MSRKAETPSIVITVAAPAWRKHAGLVPALRRAAKRALANGGAEGGLTILLTDDERMRVLNAQFRGKDKPTDVLSFPALDGGAYLGDIAIAHGVAAREARQSGKRLADHAAHLAVHGVLHLLGHDHRAAREARVMERLETRILAVLNIADPYAAGKAA